MASRTTKIKIDTELRDAALKKTADEFKKLQKQTEVNQSGLQKMGKVGAMSQGQLRFATQNAAFQLQDVAVQAQMGTDKLRILGQQGPQLLSGFGPQGALAGLVVGLGAALVSAFTLPKKSAKELEDQMEALAESGKEVAKLHFDSMEDSLEHVISRAKQAQESFSRLREEQDRTDKAAESARTKALKAEIAMAKLRGDNKTAAEAQLVLEQDLSSIEEKKSAEAQKVADNLYRINQALDEQIAKQDILKKKLADARMEVGMREEFLSGAMDEQGEALRGDRKWWALGARSIDPEKQRTAQEKVFERGQESLKAKDAVVALQREIETSEQSIIQLTREQEAANANMQATLDSIDLGADAEKASASIKNIGTTLKHFATSIEEGLAGTDDIGRLNSQALADLRRLLENGIQPQEVKGVITALNQLGVQMGAAFGSQEVTVRKIVDSLGKVQAQAAATQAKVDAIQSQRRTPLPSR